MIAFYHGVSDIFGEWYIKADDGTTAGPSTLFPSFSNYSDYTPEIDEFDMNFGLEQPLIYVQCPPWRTLFFRFWAQYVAELYSEEARIMTCTMRLTRTEIANFEFSDNIYIKDSYWRVLKLSYDANVEGVCEVQLVKILSDVAICDDEPTSYDPKLNYIRFNDSDATAPDVGSQECCEKYGYQWIEIPEGIPNAPGGTSPMYVCKPKNTLDQPTQPTT
jgi:hypothetical protein